MSTANKAAKCASQKDAKSGSNNCRFKHNEIGIIPVRYAFDDIKKDGSQQHPLPEEDRQWRGRFNPKLRNYTLRQLRDGWLYVYDETDKTFHEYQVIGHKFTKINWSSNEANKTPSERGTPGESKSCLIYPAKNTLCITFSHQRWTWRLCEHMRSHTPNRRIWMRRINLHKFNTTLKHYHAGKANVIGDYVADITTSSPSDTAFNETCTPLKPVNNENDKYNHISAKVSCLDIDYRCDLPNQENGMFIALDDPIADVSDLFLPLAKEVVDRSAILNNDEDRHKVQMAEIARSLGRVQLPENEIPQNIKRDPLKTFEFEKSLTDYLYTDYLANQEKNMGSVNAMENNEKFTPWQDKAKKNKEHLLNTYNYIPSQSLSKKLREKTIFTDEVRWNELDEYLTRHYKKLRGKDEKIHDLYGDFIYTFKRLGTDPLVLGLDNQNEDHIAYLLELIQQYLTIIKQSFNTDEFRKELDSILSLDSPNNLFALASLGFSENNWKALNDHSKEIEKDILSRSESGDMVAVAGAIANCDTFLGDSAVQETKWFKSLIKPVQNSFLALQKAVSGQAKGSWTTIANWLLPNQINDPSSLRGITSNLRLIILESLIGGEETIVKYNHNYLSEHAKWERRIKNEVAIYKKKHHSNPGQKTPKKHHVNSLRADRNKLEKLFFYRYTQLLILKNESVNIAARAIIQHQIDSSWEKGIKLSNNVWNGVEKWGGIVTVLNFWNAALSIRDIKLKSDNFTDSWYRETVILNAIFAWAYAVSAYTAVIRDKALQVISSIDEGELLKKRISIIAKNNALNERTLIKHFVKYSLACSVFGLIATISESLDIIEQVHDSDQAGAARIGNILKLTSTLAQVGLHFIQLVTISASRLGIAGSISIAFAPWILTTFAIVGVVYLIGQMIFNSYKRSELETWLLNSTWGSNKSNWSESEELNKLEQIIHRPQIELEKVSLIKASQWMDPGQQQWKIKITFPEYVRNKMIGIQITQSQEKSHYNPNINKVSRLDETNGYWETNSYKQPTYVIKTGSNTDYIITVLVSLPYNWHASKQDIIGYIASSNKEGAVEVKPANEIYASTNIHVK